MSVTVDVWEAANRVVAAPPPAGESADVWKALAKKLDPAAMRPRLGDWVEVRRFEARGGRDYAMIANRRHLVYYRLEPAEADLLPLMDGSRGIEEIVVEHLRRSGELDFAAVAELVRALYSGGFLTERYVDVDAALRDRLAAKGPRARLGRFLRTFTVEWSGAERLTVWLHRHGMRFMFTRVGMVAAAIVAIAGFVAFGFAASSHDFDLSPQSAGVGFLVLFTLNILIIVIHELGHAMLLVHYGRRVKSSGFRIYFGAPAFFIDSSDVLMLNRGRRIAQSFAGPYFEMVATGIAAVALWAWPHAGLARTLYLFVVLNYFVLFLNLVPLLELDGYWILADTIRVPDLRPRSLAFIRRELWTKLARRKRFSLSEVGLGLYGTIGVAFTVFCLWSGFFFWRRTFGGVVSKLWEAGPVGVAGLALLASFVAGPLLRALVELLRSLLRNAQAVWQRTRFRAQHRWRIEAAGLIDAQPVFDDLPVDVLNEIAGRVRLLSVGRERAVVLQGERADAYYLVRKGRLEVTDQDAETGEERVLRNVGPGESFGELGVTTGAPRNATVRAVTSVELFVIDKGTFDRLLVDRIRLPDIAPTLQALAELRQLRPFGHLSTEELVLVRDHGTWLNVAPEETVIGQGEVGDAFYAVAAGRLDVVQDGQHTRTAGPGDYVGEIALLDAVPRVATVRAATPARIYRLDRVGFDRLLAEAFRHGRLTRAAPVTFARE